MEKILLDTHALIWWAIGAKTLSRRVRRLIQDEGIAVYVSAASAWEIATKARLGKLHWATSESVESYCLGQGFELMSVTFAHGERAGSWPQQHGDPFDRMLAAQSYQERMPLATNDEKLKLFDIETIW